MEEPGAVAGVSELRFGPFRDCKATHQAQWVGGALYFSAVWYSQPPSLLLYVPTCREAQAQVARRAGHVRRILP
jgi:hypothetical protein